MRGGGVRSRLDLWRGSHSAKLSAGDGAADRPERGAIAQLGERLNGIQEVVGSIPIGSTKHSSALVRFCPVSKSPRHFRLLAALRPHIVVARRHFRL